MRKGGKMHSQLDKEILERYKKGNLSLETESEITMYELIEDKDTLCFYHPYADLVGEFSDEMGELKIVAKKSLLEEIVRQCTTFRGVNAQCAKVIK